MLTRILSDMPDTLPIGVFAPDGPRKVNVAFAPWRGRDEREIGAMRAKHRNLTPGQLATRVLARFATAWCGSDFSGLSEVERLVVLSQASAADVLTAWLHLRLSALGPEMDMDLVCPGCGHEFGFEVDLGTVEIRCPETQAETEFVVELRDGVPWRGKAPRKVGFGPIAWRGYEQTSAGDARDLAAIQLGLVAATVRTLDGDAVQLGIGNLDDVTKRDLATLLAALDANVLGPDLSVAPDCPKCAARVRATLSWVYDGFFSGSSRGRTQRTR